MNLGADQVRADLSGADALIAAEESAIAHMNEDHREALSLYATALAGMPPGDCRTTGLDPEGIDLAAGDLKPRANRARSLSRADRRARTAAVRSEDAGRRSAWKKLNRIGREDVRHAENILTAKLSPL